MRRQRDVTREIQGVSRRGQMTGLSERSTVVGAAPAGVSSVSISAAIVHVCVVLVRGERDRCW